MNENAKEIISLVSSVSEGVQYMLENGLTKDRQLIEDIKEAIMYINGNGGGAFYQ